MNTDVSLKLPRQPLAHPRREIKSPLAATPQLSVIVVNYCQWGNTVQLVRRLRRSQVFHQGLAEVVVVDNHSPPHPLMKRLRRMEGVSLRRWGRNCGFARAVNEGCRLSRGGWVLLLNPDVSVPVKFLDQLQTLLELIESVEGDSGAGGRVGVVGFGLRNTDGSPQCSSGPWPTLWRTLGRLLLPRARRKYHPPPQERSQVPWVTGCCLLVRRECLEDVGGFDNKFFLYYEDVDFCRRARARGWTVWHEPALQVVHHHPLHAREVSPSMRLLTRHALLTYARKHWPGWQAKALARVVQLEAWARQRWARWRGEDSTASVYSQLGTLAAQMRQGHYREARRVLDTVVAIPQTISPCEETRLQSRKPCVRVFSACPLSIVIPSHNRPDLLRSCLVSVVGQMPQGTEVIVVDDASPQGAVRLAAAEFPGVRTIRLERRGGFCVAANAGIVAASHPIVQLLNDDTEVCPGWAEAALARFASERVGAVAPLVLRWPGGAIGESMIDSAGDRYFVGGIAGKHGHGQPLQPAHLQPRRVFGASASSAFYRRDVLLKVGAFPEEFGAYFEDVDLSFRLHWAGYSIFYEPRSRVLHHVSASHRARPSPQLLEQQSRNEELVFWRNLPAGMLWRALPIHLLVLLGKAWRRWRQGQLLPFLRGRLQVLGHISALWKHRRWLRRLGTPQDTTEWHLENSFWE